MPNLLAASGAQSDKPVKFAPLYVGRLFSGLWTNRSPLRDAASTRIEEKFYGARGDAMIAGSNVEVTNRLTLARRPGNPIYDAVNSYTDVLSFDEFRYSKPLSDIWGTTIEQIDVMVDTATALHANNASTDTTVWTKSSGAGQSYMQPVGSQLYFGNGIDAKKWNQSLFVRTAASNSQPLNTDAYGFMDTYLIDSNGNIQQLIGVQIASIAAIAISNNLLTVTLATSLGTGFHVDHAGGYQSEGTKFILWGLAGTAVDFLEGATISLSQEYKGGTTLTADFTHANVSTVSGLSGILQIASGVTSGTADTLTSAVLITSTPTAGSSVPIWGTTVPAVANNFEGSITVDGNLIWVNRGLPTQNWGLAAPTVVPEYGATGQETGFAANTYYSPVSVYQDPTHGNLWQIMSPGVLGTPEPTWPAVVVKANKTQVVTVSISIVTNHITVTTDSSVTLGSINGTVVTMLGLEPTAFLNGVPLTVISHTAHAFVASYTYPITYTADQTAGVLVWGGTQITDGDAIWTCIQTAAQTNSWSAGTVYANGSILIETPVGKSPCYYLLRTDQVNSTGQAIMSSASTTYFWKGGGTMNGTNGNVALTYPAASTVTSNYSPTSLHTQYYQGNTDHFGYYPIDGAGKEGAEIQISTSNPGETEATVAPIYIPAAGTYTFNCSHSCGAFYAFEPSEHTGNGGVATNQTGGFNNAELATTTIYKGYPNPCGTNNFTTNPAGTTYTNDTSTWLFTKAGIYYVEIDSCTNCQNGSGTSKMVFTCNTLPIALAPAVSGATQPIWPSFSPLGTAATYNVDTDEIYFSDTVTDSGGQWVWNNIGPVSDFLRSPGVYYTLPSAKIIDSYGDQEGAYETGFTGTTEPSWGTLLNTVVADPNPNLSWINEGPVPISAPAAGTITATTKQGWIYGISLVNTLDNTVSNIGPVSASTGPLVGAKVQFDAGAGLNVNVIDPQADYVAIFRTADGMSTKLLLAGFGNTIYTVPLVQYLNNGYIDATPDLDLDFEAEAPQNYEDTPPLTGAINLTYHLSRIFYSIGNTVFWTSGPDDPVGNGLNGFGANNYDRMTSIVKRLVPTSAGLLVFTVSDVIVIPDNQGTILPSLPYTPGIGLGSYNALDTNGPTIGFFSTDHQFMTYSPQMGASIDSTPLADQFALTGGSPGQDWVPSDMYIVHHTSGQDMGWYVADGATGWFRHAHTLAPEPGAAWSPYATIQGGVGAIKSVEVAPGVHRLLLGPIGTGYIRYRDVTATTDGGLTGSTGTAYPAYAVMGSYVLAQAGQVAQVGFITTDSVNVGSPLIIGLLIDEALPYYQGSFEIYKNWVSDPPGLKPSKSIIGQRFYLSDSPDQAAAMRHMQLMIQWPAENAANELQAFVIYGCFVQEN